MSKRLNVKVDSCYDCPRAKACMLQTEVGKSIPNECPLPDDEIVTTVTECRWTLEPSALSSLRLQIDRSIVLIDYGHIEEGLELLRSIKLISDDEPVKIDWKTEEEKEAFIKAWREAMGHESEED